MFVDPIMNTRVDIKFYRSFALKTLAEKKVIGTVVGVNIKPFNNCFANQNFNSFYPQCIGKEVYTFVLHVKVPEGDQYDLIWLLHHGDVLNMTNDGILRHDGVRRIKVKKLKKLLKRYKQAKISYERTRDRSRNQPRYGRMPFSNYVRVEYKEFPIIPNIMKVCGAKEWVEIIGSTIEIGIPTAATGSRVKVYIKPDPAIDSAFASTCRPVIPELYSVETNNNELYEALSM